jgi:excisionase family DNA binding protein
MKFMTMNEVAETLSVSRMTIYRLVSKYLKVGRAVRIPEESIKEYVDRNLKGNGGEHPQRKLSESEFSLEGMFTEGEPIPKEAIDEVIKEWERE